MDEHFPFLIAHGPVVWRLVLVVLVVLVVGAIWAIRYAAARHAIRSALRQVRVDHGAIRALRGGGATTVSIVSPASNPHETAVASCRADQFL